MQDTSIVPSVLAVMVLIFVATIIYVVTRRVRLPFPVALVVVGLLLRGLAALYPSLNPLTQFGLPREVLIYIFLPTLGFEAAFSMDSRLLLKNIIPVMVLAIPGVLIATVLGGLGLAWTIGMPISVALLFGALLANTDTTAVLAVFKNLGAPKRLMVLTEGENLLNDPTSIVIFQLFLTTLGLVGGAAMGHGAGLALDLLSAFMLNFFGSLAIGLIAGVLFGKMIERLETDDLIDILLTTVVAYLPFLIADVVFHLSGIMASVGAGLVLSGWGRTKFEPETLQYLERFWVYLAFVSNALIFLLVGLATDLRFMWSVRDAIGWTILISLVARTLSVLGVFQVVNRLPGVERTGLGYQIAMSWGGLRGALSLVMALALPESFAYRNVIVGATFGVVLFSLLVQGLTLEPLMRVLGLNRSTLSEQFLRDDSLLIAKHRAKLRIPELLQSGMFSERIAGDLEKAYEEEEQTIRARIDTLREGNLIGEREELKLLKRQYLLMEKRTYLDLYHKGQLSEKILKDLHHSIEYQLDHLRLGGSPPAWTIHSPLRWKVEASMFRFLDRVLPASDLAQQLRLGRIAERYEEHWGRLVASDQVLDELRRHELRGGTADGLIAEMRRLYGQWNVNARGRLDAISEQFPEYATKVQQIIAMRLCLQAEQEAIQEMYRLDVLPEREAEKIREEVQRKLRSLRQKPLQELRPRPEEILQRVPLFAALPPEEIGHVTNVLRLRTFLADEVIVNEGAEGDSLFLIARGVVRVSVYGPELTEVPIATLVAGDFFGEMAVITQARRSATVRAVTHCTLYELKRADLHGVESVCPTVRHLLEATTRDRAAELEVATGS